MKERPKVLSTAALDGLSDCEIWREGGTSGNGRDSHVNLTSRYLYPGRPAIQRVLLENIPDEPEISTDNVADWGVNLEDLD